MVALAETLERFGIETSAEEVERMVVAAVEELLSDWRPMRADPGFTEAEAAELRDAGLDLESRDYGADDPVLKAATRYAAVLASSLSVGQVAQLLGVDSSRVRHRLAERSIYGIRLRKEWRIPTFQFENGQLLPRIDQVLPELPPDLHPMDVLGWFTTPDPDLVVDGRAVCPRDWLRLGKKPRELADVAASLDHEL